MFDSRTKEIVGIVLAAGMSQRMGRTKQLVQIDGESLVSIVARTCTESALDRVIVVVGHDSTAVTAALEPLPVEIVFNPAYTIGQSTSLRTGVLSTTKADAVVMILGDQPGIQAGAIDALINARREGAVIAMTDYAGTRSHPVLFGYELFDELLEVTGDQGAREVITRHRNEVVAVPSAVAEVPTDIDTEDDLQRITGEMA